MKRTLVALALIATSITAHAAPNSQRFDCSLIDGTHLDMVLYPDDTVTLKIPGNRVVVPLTLEETNRDDRSISADAYASNGYKFAQIVFGHNLAHILLPNTEGLCKAIDKL
ncbi:TPA: hypothetical protein NU503_004401 [Escherichia coli]|uniref:hypothetical protein n=1 Tax=Escherichia coli TaxID=562 RepID=UPI0028075747|nr:hypothetical protein [Escherichia coli]MDQ8135828.1 hypothetical protein [Escherichia coli]BEC49094.1 hypothetical protein VEE53_45930 [Escherichia coli]HCJ5921464.1 hypothetical protein [Escherichia coli]HCJ6171282.1 hypothetical protein [Escherichia coli]HCJ8815872.1 hypothetical protein [Escherichia coli]